MFCDLVESTPLTELLDPEELHLVISAYQNMCFHVVSRFEGYTAQYLGDGLLMYFGYPQAHEDDAARAVRAGLELVAELKQLTLRLQDEVGVLHHRPLRIRVGIHTGLVVVSEMGKGERRELMALGEAPNVANRLQMIAEPNSVVLSAVTQRLTEGLFSCQPLGLRTLRGVSTPMPVYRVLHEQDIRNRFEIAVSRGLTPLIGRERSLELLLQVWKKAQAGVGQVVLLKGEAGIGKSRLVQSLKDQLISDTYLRLEYHCSPYHQHSALYPVLDLLQRMLGFSREDTAEQKLQKLENVLNDAKSGFSFPSMDPTEVRLLLAALLSIPMPENFSPLRLSPQRQKQKTLDLLSHWVVARAATQPVLIIVEDLHWADPSTLELLSLVFDRQPTARILIVLTFRPDFIPPWSQNDLFSLISLSRLSHEQVVMMVNSLVGKKSLPTEMVNQIVLRTDGVPLFVEELTKTVLESGFLRENAEGYELTGVLPSVSIPATLQDSLMARLDRLGAVKELAQLAAVVGREFPYELLQVLVADESSLLRGLQQLTDTELVYQRGAPPEARYFFKHALVQDAAYQSLLKSKRKQLHTQIAQVLETQFPEIVNAHPELVAHHYTQAERPQSAIYYWREAGMRASARAAHAEAIQHFTAALNLMSQLPEEVERDRIELAIQVQLGLSLAARKGYAAPEVEQTYNRARDLCARLGESADLFPVVRGLCTFYIVRDEQKTARELAEQCLRLAQATRNETYLIEGYTALGYVACYQGELETATAALQEGVTLYNSHRGEQLPSLTPQDPGVACLSLLALVWWLQGETEQALRHIHDARVLAQQLKQPFNVTYVHAYKAMLHQLLRQPVEAAKSARAVIQISEEHGFDVWLGAGVLHLGIAQGELGEHEEGITLIRQTLAAWRAGGAELLRPYFLAGLVETYLAAGQYEEAMMAVSEALAHVGRHGERFYESTLYRLRGEARLARAAEAWGEAEADFQSAITIAHSQKAKALELQATISLSRCLRAQGKQDDARRLLHGIVRQFPQGENSLDLQEARELLAELG
jgi:predicted ATPase/class 3 adenylate cyclase